MPIYPKHRLVHIHIPKTGGTAIQKYFHDSGDRQWTPEGGLGQAYRDGRWYEHGHLSM